ncbi:tryptophan synthase beta chain [Streptomyces griseochromogenes]|uniref:tryptophan synthase n=1 Tax=Streptomyces griseochromogenes TaxID=68214 RepID=A0A1B1B3Q2_9ACTN|nr:TrpB-like pyridoxal phosphate-dependent enzyme [Streptomyces griseochromogenes]ANP53433.1 TrpB-like pyridoxal-phosphate dependent enzyme [Streptomyces griseochromogenes]MBP2054750.1 tryptophan synthase beta chain [Streptomyces griseochromogenes]
MTALERYDLPVSAIPKRWYNVLPDLPRGLDDYLHPVTREPVGQEFMERLLPKALVAQETSTDRWIAIPEEVRAAYRLWRPTPLYRATALERHLDTPAEIYFKYEGSSPSGSHKLNSALAQAYYAGLEGVDRLVTDTGAGQWGSALSMACSLFGIKALVYMVRASFQSKPYRRHLMETFGQQVLPSPGPHTDFGRALLADTPDHPGSEATAVSEALETVRLNAGDRFSMGAFANHVLLHQTVIGLETREQLEEIGKQPDFLVASVGCGSNLGGFVFPFVGDKLAGAQIGILAAEPAACPTLTAGEYRYDFADAGGLGPMTRTYTLGHEFVPPPIHSGGLRYHGAAPLVGLARHEGLLDARAYAQKEVFEAGTLFARLHGLLPAPETAHTVRATIELAEECRRQRRRAVIVFCYSGHGLLDLGAYGSFNAGEMADTEPYECTLAAGDPALAGLTGR